MLLLYSYLIDPWQNSSWVNLDHHHSMDIEMCYPVGDLNYLNKKGRRSEIVFLGVFMDAYPNSI